MDDFEVTDGVTGDSLNPKKMETTYIISKGETICIPNPPSHNAFATGFLHSKPEKRKTPDDIEVEDEDEIEDEDPPSKSPLSVSDRLKPSEFYDKFVARTPTQCIEELAAPQRSDAWLLARKFSITASQFGSATGLSPYQTPDELVMDKVWNTFEGNAATEWGTLHEKHAKDVFLEWFLFHLGSKFEFVEENLMKYSAEPWMAASPDGILKYEQDGKLCYDLVEFKCPAYLRSTKNHPYAKYNNIPPHYKAQIQGVMGYLNAHSEMKFERCWFVVWQPHQTWITLQPFDAEYYADLHKRLETWYFNKLLPAFTHQYNGLISKGFLQPHEEIVVETK
jgi:putative phage-type endonuclease